MLAVLLFMIGLKITIGPSALFHQVVLIIYVSL